MIVGLRDISDGFYILPGFQKGITVMQYGVMPAFMLSWMVFLLHKKRYPMAIFVSLCLLQCLLSQASDAFVLYLFISAPLLWLVYCIGSGCIFYLAYFSVSGGLPPKASSSGKLTYEQKKEQEKLHLLLLRAGRGRSGDY